MKKSIIFTMTVISLQFLFLNLSAQEANSKTKDIQKNKKISKRMEQIRKAYEMGGRAAAFAQSQSTKIKVVSEDMLEFSVIVSNIEKIGDVIKTVEALGGTVRYAFKNELQILLSFEHISSISFDTNVTYVRETYRARANAVTGEQVPLLSTDTANSLGITGQGIKVAIIDGGFSNFSGAQAAGDLPASITYTNDYTVDGNINIGSTHGTAVAEMVYEMANNVELILLKVSSIAELESAKNYCKANGVKIVNMSLCFPFDKLSDGNNESSEIVNDASANGILWCNSAGNYGQMHYCGTYTNRDGYHEFSSLNKYNYLGYLEEHESIFLMLKWNDTWGASGNDYDLYLYYWDGTSYLEAGSGNDFQNGTGDPIELISGYISTAGHYYVAIKKYSGVAKRLHLYSLDQNLSIKTSARSLLPPADASGSFTVGAISCADWTNGIIETFSSCGPTWDGRIKPEICGVDGVSSFSYPSRFYGTSASSPSIAGFAALIWSANTTKNAAFIKAFITNNAIDCGISGADNTYGYGKANFKIISSVLTPVVNTSYSTTSGQFSWTTAALSNSIFNYHYQISTNKITTYLDESIVSTSPMSYQCAVENGLSYFARVRITNQFDEGEWTAWSEGVTGDTSIPSLNTLVCVETNQNSFVLNFSASDSISGVSNYIISNRATGEVSYSYTGSHTVSALYNGANYSMAIAAMDCAINPGQSGYTGNMSIFSHIDVTTLFGVPIISQVADGLTNVGKTLSCSFERGSMNTNNFLYHIDILKNTSGALDNIYASTSDTSFTYQPLVHNSTYQVRVRATNVYGSGDWTVYSTAVLADTLPPTISMLSCVETNSTLAKLKFIVNDDPYGYVISNWNTGVLITNFSENKTNIHTIYQLNQTTAYTMGVYAFDRYWNFTAASNIAFTTLLDITPPYIISITTPEGSRVFTNGDIIPIDLNFSEDIELSKPMYLACKVNSTETISNTSDFTNKIRFNYNVQNGVFTQALDVVSIVFSSNDAEPLTHGTNTIKDRVNLSLNLSPAYTTLYPDKNLRIDTLAPTVKVTNIGHPPYLGTNNFEAPVTVRLTVDEEFGYFYYERNGLKGAILKITDSRDTVIREPGKLTFYSLDQYGNSRSPETITYTFDSPDLSLAATWKMNDPMTTAFFGTLSSTGVNAEVLGQLNKLYSYRDGVEVMTYIAQRSGYDGKRTSAVTTVSSPSDNIIFFAPQKKRSVFERITTIIIQDTTGNVVNTLRPNAAAATWDKKDNSGIQVPAGFYKAILEYSGGQEIVGFFVTR